ncbi:MAG: hypothetical protein ISS70_17195 [Phycisphaerae bacterium]|nr:hypothetical protein [Phycisphaerae bacterium]
MRDTEQQGDGKAEYSVRLLEHLSGNLQGKLGSGFSICNPRNMRRFCLDNRIHQTSGELNWSQHVELLPVTNNTENRPTPIRRRSSPSLSQQPSAEPVA